MTVTAEGDKRDVAIPRGRVLLYQHCHTTDVFNEGYTKAPGGNRYYRRLDYRSVRALVSVVASVRTTHLEIDIEKNRKGSPDHENQEKERVSDVTSRVRYEADNEGAHER